MLSFRLVFLVLAICVAPQAYASSAEPMPIVSAMRTAYASMKNFSATFSQQLTHMDSGSEEVRKGTLVFKKPLFIRWETEKPNAEILIVNEDAVWNYLPEDRLVYKYSKEIVKDSMAIIQVLTGQASLDQDFDITSEPNDDNLILLRLQPKNPTTQMVEAQLWLNPNDGLIRKAKVVDFYGNTNLITFLKITPDSPLNKNAFKLNPPKGVAIEDLTDKATPERPLFN